MRLELRMKKLLASGDDDPQWQRRSRVGCARAGRGCGAGSLSSRLLRPPSPPWNQPERLADLGVELVPAPELGQRRGDKPMSGPRARSGAVWVHPEAWASSAAYQPGPGEPSSTGRAVVRSGLGGLAQTRRPADLDLAGHDGPDGLPSPPRQAVVQPPSGARSRDADGVC